MREDFKLYKKAISLIVSHILQKDVQRDAQPIRRVVIKSIALVLRIVP